MYFVIIGIDQPGMADVRLQVRPVHRDYLHANHPHIALKLAGPLLASDGKTMIGSLVVIEAPDLVTAQSFASGDPYRVADLFQEVTIRPWSWTAGNPDA